MIQRIKKSLFVFSTVLLGILYPFISSAGWVDNLKRGIGTYILFLLVKLFVNIAKFFTGLAGSLLNWVLSPNFISYSYTNPANNPIIETGLGVTQGFVNMLLVLVLVYIAIATILRLAGYETKKLLVTFLIVALLVNFAPVICGLIVDASNIVMNFFIQDLKADAFGTTMARSVEEISAGFDELTEVESAWPFITQLAVMVPFLWVLTFILLLFTLVFILRYLIIWLLVILSPLAFACYILPITRKYFNKWWEQFINWSFVGISCSFFLYLGLLLVTKIQAGAAVSTPVTAGNAVFDGILPYFVSVVFLGIGFVFGLQTSAMGASTVINFTKARGRGTLRGATRGAGWVGGKVWKKGIKPSVERPTRFAVDKLSRAASRIGNLGYKGIKPFAPVKWAIPEKVRQFGNIRPSIEKAEKESGDESGAESMARVLTQADTGAVATGRLIKTLKNNDAQDIFNEARKIGGWKGMNDQEILKDKKFIKVIAPLLKHANQAGMLGTTLRRDPRLAKIAASGKVGAYKGLSQQKAVTKATSEAREHIKDWEPESLNDPEVLMACLAQFDRDRWLQVNRQVKNGQNTALKSMDKVFADFKQKNKTKLSGKSDKNIWDGEFREFIKTNYGGDKYFTAIPEKRMQSTGWRIAKTPTPETPGAAAMGSQPPKERTKPLKPGGKTKEEKENEPKK